MTPPVKPQPDLAKLQTDVALLKQFNEKWLPVVGYEGLYEISNIGRVRSLDRIVKHKTIGTQKVLGRIMKNNMSGKYQRVMLSKNGKTKQFSVHRLLAAAFIPNPLNKKTVNHIDGNKLNCTISNLEWATYSENRFHALETGLAIIPRGEKSHASKLKYADVLDIRKRVFNGEMSKNLAKEYGISRSNVTAITHGRSWSGT